MSIPAQQEPMELVELEREMLVSAFHAHQETTVLKPALLHLKLIQATTHLFQVCHLLMLYTSAHPVTSVSLQA